MKIAHAPWNLAFYANISKHMNKGYEVAGKVYDSEIIRFFSRFFEFDTTIHKFTLGFSWYGS